MTMKTVAKKAAHHVKRHKYKIVLSAPIVFAIFVNVDIATPLHTLSLIPQETIFIAVDDTTTVDITLSTNEYINATGASFSFDDSTLAIRSLSFENSIIDLWVQKPAIENISFGGGITTEEPFSGAGNIFSFTVQALQEGKTTISFVDPEILANDGMGTNLLTEKKDVTFYIRKQGLPSPDVNDDGKISLMDINIVYFNSLRKDNPRYDLNGDGKVSLGDVRLLLCFLM